MPFLLAQEDLIQHDYLRSVAEQFLRADGLSRPLALLRGIEEIEDAKRRVVTAMLQDALIALTSRGATETIRQLAAELVSSHR